MGEAFVHRDDGTVESHCDYLKNLRILVVDPSPFMRRTVVGVLRFFGCLDYRESSDGATALEMMRTWVPDIILTEYAMTPLDGVDLTRILRTEKSELRFVPIVMVTAWSEGWRVCQARDAGVSEFVVKPFSAKGLMLRILEAVFHQRPFVEAATYSGPDRRRRLADGEALPQRRTTDMTRRDSVSQEDADRLIAGEALISGRVFKGNAQKPVARDLEPA